MYNYRTLKCPLRLRPSRSPKAKSRSGSCTRRCGTVRRITSVWRSASFLRWTSARCTGRCKHCWTGMRRCGRCFVLATSGELFQRVFDCQSRGFRAELTFRTRREEQTKAGGQRGLQTSLRPVEGPLLRAHLFTRRRAGTACSAAHRASHRVRRQFDVHDIDGASATVRRHPPSCARVKHSYREFVEWQSEVLAGRWQERSRRTGRSKSKMRRTFSISQLIIRVRHISADGADRRCLS